MFKLPRQFTAVLFYNIGPRGQSYKNSMANYHSNFNPTFCRVKMVQYIAAILG